MQKKMFTLIGGLIVVSFLSGCANKGAVVADPNYDAAGKRKAVIVKQTARGAQITSDERILFDIGKSDIKPEGRVFIDRVATILKEKTKANVIVEGHTDNVGTAQANNVLSTQRANSVRSALVAKGVTAQRIQAQGFGFTKPVADNATADGRQINRRTEIIVIGETVENISGGNAASLGDQLSAGLDKFLEDAGNILKNVFGSSEKK